MNGKSIKKVFNYTDGRMLDNDDSYDGDKCGLLDMNHFQRFYYDFRAQLSPFFHQLPFQADPRDGRSVGGAR